MRLTFFEVKDLGLSDNNGIFAFQAAFWSILSRLFAIAKVFTKQ